MSSELSSRTKKAQVFVPEFVWHHEELVRQVHQDYADAGADILVAATAAANRLNLKRHQMEHRFLEVNRQAVNSACAARDRSVGNDRFVFGGLGPTNALLKPYGSLTELDYREVFVEQAQVLLNQGVDGFILEGFQSLIEAEQCIIALHELTSHPIIATMTFLEDGNTHFGDSIEDCFQAMLRKGADMVGVHGTLGPLEIDEYLATLKEQYPLCIRPNAGYPVRIGNLMTYLSSPEYVAEYAESFASRGVSVIGGAAGFSPNHIKAVAQRVHSLKPLVPQNIDPTQVVTSATQTNKNESDLVLDERSLSKKLGKEPLLTVELEPPKGLEFDSLIELLKKIKPYGVDAVNIPENPLARARVSSIALAKVIREKTGLESIAHLTCRDRNLISLQAELLGAHVLGVNTILALTGDPAGVGDYPTATSIFDVNSAGLVEIMARMNLGKDFGMNDIGASTQFTIGVAANPLAKNMAAEMERLERKLKGGARFIQTQPIFDPKAVEPFLKAIEAFQVPVIFGVMLVRDFRHAKFLVNEYPGIRITEKDLLRFEQTGAKDQDALGIDFACELVRELQPMSGGVYLMPSFGDAHRLVQVFEKL